MMLKASVRAAVTGLVLGGCSVQAAERVKANNTTNLNVTASWTNGVSGVYDYGK